MEGSVVQTTGKVEFEDDLRKEVFHRGYWCHCGDCTKPRINSNTLLGGGLVLGVVQLSYGPLSEQIQILCTSHYWYLITAVIWCLD